MKSFAIISGMRALANIIKLFVTLILVVVIAALLVVGIPNAVEIIGQQGNIVQEEDLAESGEEYDCILVLGAAVNADGTPTTILQDRLDVAIELYEAGVAPKIIVSGDDKSDLSYDEVQSMKSYMVSAGVPSSDVFCDHAGICTYDSMYRARYVFEAENMVVVTQTYHLYRALYDANSLGVQSVGVTSDLHSYADQDYYNQREFLARVSDFTKVVTKQTATYTSEPVSLDQSGDVTSW